MESLRRTRAAGFTIEQALTLSQVQQAKEEGRLEELIRPVDTVFSEYPALMVKATRAAEAVEWQFTVCR